MLISGNWSEQHVKEMHNETPANTSPSSGVTYGGNQQEIRTFRGAFRENSVVREAKRRLGIARCSYGVDGQEYFYTLDLQSDEYNIGQNRITPLRFIVVQATDMSNLNVEDDKYNLRHFISENNNGLENVSNLRIHVARESLDGKLSYNCVRRSFAVIDDVFDILYTTSQSSKRDIFWNSENSSIEIKRLFYSKIRHIYGCLGNIFETSLAGTPMSPLPYDLEIILDNSQERNSFPKVHLRGHLHTSMTILSQWRLKEEAESLLGEHRDESPSVRCTQWLLSLCASGFLSQLPSDSDFIPQRQKESFLERQQLRYKALVELCTSASVLIELDSLISDLRLPIRKHAEVLAVAFRLSSSRLSLSDINMQSTEKPVEQWLSAIEAWVDDESNLPFTEFTQHNIQEIFCSVLQQTEEDLNDWICLFNTIPSNTNNIFSFMDTSIYKLGTTDDKYTHRVRIRISCDVDQSLQLVSNRSLGIPKSILFQRHWCPPMARSVSKRDYFISLTPSPGNVEIRFVLKNLEISGDELKSQEILSDLKDVRNLITRIKARAQISNIKPTTQSVVLVVLSPIDTLKLARVVALSCPLNTLGKSRSYLCDTVKEEDILVPDRLNFGKLHFINSLKHVSALQTMWNWLKLSTTEAITSYEIQNAQEELYDVVTDGSGMYRLISTKAVSLYSLLTSRTIAARKIAELTGATVYALASFVIVRRKQAFAVDLKTKKIQAFCRARLAALRRLVKEEAIHQRLIALLEVRSYTHRKLNNLLEVNTSNETDTTPPQSPEIVSIYPVSPLAHSTLSLSEDHNNYSVRKALFGPSVRNRQHLLKESPKIEDLSTNRPYIPSKSIKSDKTKKPQHSDIGLVHSPVVSHWGVSESNIPSVRLKPSTHLFVLETNYRMLIEDEESSAFHKEIISELTIAFPTTSFERREEMVRSSIRLAHQRDLLAMFTIAFGGEYCILRKAIEEEEEIIRLCKLYCLKARDYHRISEQEESYRYKIEEQEESYRYKIEEQEAEIFSIFRMPTKFPPLIDFFIKITDCKKIKLFKSQRSTSLIRTFEAERKASLVSLTKYRELKILMQKWNCMFSEEYQTRNLLISFFELTKCITEETSYRNMIVVEWGVATWEVFFEKLPRLMIGIERQFRIKHFSNSVMEMEEIFVRSIVEGDELLEMEAIICSSYFKLRQIELKKWQPMPMFTHDSRYLAPHGYLDHKTQSDVHTSISSRGKVAAQDALLILKVEQAQLREIMGYVSNKMSKPNNNLNVDHHNPNKNMSVRSASNSFVTYSNRSPTLSHPVEVSNLPKLKPLDINRNTSIVISRGCVQNWTTELKSFTPPPELSSPLSRPSPKEDEDEAIPSSYWVFGAQ